MLIGEQEIKLEYGDEVYSELGAKAYVGGIEVDAKITIDTSNIDYNKLGTYEVVYSFVDPDGNTVEEKRFVTIVDTKVPTLILKGKNPQVVYINEEYIEYGYTVTDNYDTDMDNRVTITSDVDVAANGNYKVVYRACDSSDNCIEKSRTVVVKNRELENYVRINLLGDNNVYLEWPEKYTEPGFVVESSDGDIANQVTISGTVNKEVLGTYTLTYRIVNSKGLEDSATRTVIVRDTTKPVITLEGDSHISLILEDPMYVDEGAKAIDNHDGDITSDIKINSNYVPYKVGTFNIKYSVIDSSGNKTEIVRVIEVSDITSPVLTINPSDANVIVERGMDYDVLKGVSATDNYDTDINDRIIYYSNPILDLNKVGTYIITYRVSDSSGNEAVSVNKTIEVRDTIAPTGNITYNITDPTNGSVRATLTTSEEIKTPNGWQKKDEITYTKVFNINTSALVTIEDLAGNTNSIVLSIMNIDVIAPTATVSYEPNTSTTEDVVVTLTAVEKIQTPNGYTKIDDFNYKKTYTNNVSENVIIIDMAGNSNTINIVVDKIDKEKPVIKIIGDNPVTVEQGSVYTDLGATATDNVDGDITAGITVEGLVNTGIVGNYTVTYKVSDTAGNETTISRRVIVNDSTKPTGNITRNPNGYTNGSVLVTMTTSEEIITPSGWTKVNTTTYTKPYTDNVEGEILEIKDLNGNIGTVEITVTNIDTVPPVIEIDGPNPYNFPLGEVVYVDLGATATDDIDGPVTVNSESKVVPSIEGEYEVIYTARDTAGNIATAKRIVRVIDMNPNSNITYSPITSIPTNDKVIVTILVDRPVSTPVGWANTSGDNQTFTKDYNSNITGEVVEFFTLDGYNFRGEQIVTINNIDKTAPTATITYEPSNATNGNVIAKLVANEKIQRLTDWTKVDDYTYTKVFLSNIDTTVTITDLAGNIGSATVAITWIDDSAPVPTITYSTTNVTKDNVIVTLKTNKAIQTPTNWTRISDKEFKKEYSQNTPAVENYEIKDTLGNIGTAEVYITWIDKDAPVINILGRNPERINQGETYIEAGVKATDDRDGDITSKVVISGNNINTNIIGIYDVTYTVIDTAGNTTTAIRRVIVEDLIAPTATITYSTLNKTKDPVLVTLKTSEPINQISGWTKVDDYTYTLSYDENVSNETVSFSDKAGNSGLAIVNITWIDNIAPSANVTLSPETLTNGVVLATIKANEKIKTPSGFTKVDDQIYTKVYTARTVEDVVIEDLVGNKTTLTVNIANIDKLPPSIFLSYDPSEETSGNVEVTMLVNEEIEDPKGWTKVENTLYKKTYETNVTEHISVKDKAGNYGDADLVIDWINTVKPIPTIEISPSGKTNGNVTVTMRVDKPIIDPGNGFVKVDDYTYTKTYTDNTVSTGETYEIEDTLGNKNTVTIYIDTIDRISPVITVTPNTTELTNGNVLLTLKANETIVALNNWQRIDEYTYTRVFDRNDTYTLTVYDVAGNSTDTLITVTNIDKVAPTATLEYSKTTPTNDYVRVTLTSTKDILPPKGWSTVDSKTYTRDYQTNATEIITVEDLAGNTNSVSVNITNIDKIIPTGVASYNPETPVKDKVTVTIKTNKLIEIPENWNRVNNTTYTRDYYANSNTPVTIKDAAGNTGTVDISVYWIDSVPPSGTITYNTTSRTRFDVTATLTVSEATQDIDGWNKVSNTVFTKVITNNTEGIQTVTFKDLVGNQSTANYNVTWIDKTAPTGSITYEPNGPTVTNNEVTATLKVSESINITSDWTKVDNATYTKKYSENNTDTIKFTDLAGNPGSSSLSITWIDTKAPTATVSYDPNGPALTNKDVKVTLDFDEEVVESELTDLGFIRQGGNLYTKIYIANYSGDIEVTDLAGNKNDIRVTITWIDKIAPVVNVTYSDANPTKENVKVTLTANKEIRDITLDGWVRKNLTTYEKTYTSNGTETIRVIDLAGNSVDKEVSITNIDKTNPIGTITFVDTNPTKEDVIGTLTLSEKIKTAPTGFAKVDDLTYTKLFTVNESGTAYFEDLVGNTGNATYNVTWIDKTAPTGIITYKYGELTSEDEVITLVVSEELKETPTEFTKVDNLTYTKTIETNESGTVNFEDLVGNTGTVNYSVTWVDKNVPVASVSYVPNTPTPLDVVVTLTVDKEITTPSGWSNPTDDHKTFIKTYTENGSETVLLNDPLGNTGSKEVSVTWIDKVAPTGTITYKYGSLTNDDEEITLTVSEELKETPTGFTKVDNLTYTKTIESNESGTVYFIDKAGNNGSNTYNITWIDKTSPILSIDKGDGNPTNQNITVTITSNEEITLTDGWTNPTDDHKTFIKIFESNEEVTVTATDMGSDFTIILVGENKIEHSFGYMTLDAVINATDGLTIKGSGSLNMIASVEGEGIEVKTGNLVIDNTTITLKNIYLGRYALYVNKGDLIVNNSNITINNYWEGIGNKEGNTDISGTLDINISGVAIKAEKGDIVIGGTLTAYTDVGLGASVIVSSDEGDIIFNDGVYKFSAYTSVINGMDNIIINGGTFDIKAKNNAYGIEAYYGKIKINNAIMNMETDRYSLSSNENNIEIEGSKINIKTNGDSVFSRGLIIKKSELKIVADGNPVNVEGSIAKVLIENSEVVLESMSTSGNQFGLFLSGDKVSVNIINSNVKLIGNGAAFVVLCPADEEIVILGDNMELAEAHKLKSIFVPAYTMYITSYGDFSFSDAGGDIENGIKELNFRRTNIESDVEPNPETSNFILPTIISIMGALILIGYLNEKKETI